MSAYNRGDRHRFEQGLRGNILPFWIEHTVDRVNVCFCVCADQRLHVHNAVE